MLQENDLFMQMSTGSPHKLKSIGYDATAPVDRCTRGNARTNHCRHNTIVSKDSCTSHKPQNTFSRIVHHRENQFCTYFCLRKFDADHLLQ